MSTEPLDLQDRAEEVVLGIIKRLVRQRDEARAEVERLQAELKRAELECSWVVAEADDDLRARYFEMKRKERTEGGA